MSKNIAGCEYCATEVFHGHNGSVLPPAPWAPTRKRALCWNCKWKQDEADRRDAKREVSHHMDEGGSYDGWSNHEIVVRSSLAFGLDITIKGNNRNDVKEYLHDVYAAWLGSAVEADKTSY